MKARLLILLFLVFTGCEESVSIGRDPLPSWNESSVKKSIVSFVKEATKEGSKGYIPPEDRIATFDNDGTLWSEVPIVEVEFTKARLETALREQPALRNRGPFKTLVAKGKAALPELTQKDILDIMSLTHSGMSEDEFKTDVQQFFATARHPKYKAPFENLTFKPMKELVRYLQDNDFKVFICSGGDVAFMRVVAPKIYGIPSENIIGSFFVDKVAEKDGKLVVNRTSQLALMNDKAGKLIGIMRHIGKRPVFAAGNVLSGGDVEHLRFSSEGNRPSLQLLVNHDDEAREAAYAEKDNRSLDAAKQFKWHVISVKTDWKQVFDDDISKFNEMENRVTQKDP